jgi:hypothetical protein
MFRSDLTAVSLFGSTRTARPQLSFQPAVEALEERVVLDASQVNQLAQLAYYVDQAVSSLALQLTTAHVSKKGLGNLLLIEQSFRQVMQNFQAIAPSDCAGCQQLFQLFQQADGVFVQEVTALANGHKVPADVKIQALALAQTGNSLDQALNAVNNFVPTTTAAPTSSSSDLSCGT